VYGDSAYADGATLDEQAARGHDMRAKVPAVRNPNGYSKDRFTIDLAAGTVTCPAQRDHRPGRASPCGPLRGTMRLVSAAGGMHQSPPRRVISIHPHEAALQQTKARQIPPGSRPTGSTGPSWNARSATSPAGPGAGEKPAAAARNAS